MICFPQSLGGNLRVSGTVSGIDPTSADLHGFHVHSSSDMSNGCTSTGGHFNPFGKNHGAPSDVERFVFVFASSDLSLDFNFGFVQFLQTVERQTKMNNLVFSHALN